MAVLKAHHLALGTCEVDRPSEPVLAVAAVHTLWGFANNSPLDVALSALKQLAVPPNEGGELLSMFLFVMAQHRANLVGSEIYSHKDPSSYVKPVPLTSFLEAFVLRQQLRDLPSGGRVRVLQFIKITESNYIPGHKDLAQAFRRGAAYACAPLQPGINAIIPICYGDEPREDNMGYALVHIKNDAAGANLKQVMAAVSGVNERRRLQSNGQPSVQMVISLRGDNVTQAGLVGQEPAQSTQKAKRRGKGPPPSPAVFQIIVQSLTGMSILKSENTPSETSGAHIGTAASATQFLSSGGTWGKAKGSNSLSQRMGPLAGSGRDHHSYAPQYEDDQILSGNSVGSSSSSDVESSGREGSDVEIIET